jgi:MFS superfamily sulfate permease-like transporter
VGVARAFSLKHRHQVDPSQGSLARGAANVESGLAQGIPVSTGLCTVSSAGVRTRVIIGIVLSVGGTKAGA